MPRFSRLTPETAVGSSRDLLGDLVERHGEVGDMVSTMAHSPAVLGGYLQLSKAMRRAKLDRKVSELVSIAVQSQQGCGMCLASHISAARSLGVSDNEIALAQQGTAMTGPVAAMIAPVSSKVQSFSVIAARMTASCHSGGMASRRVHCRQWLSVSSWKERAMLPASSESDSSAPSTKFSSDSSRKLDSASR